MKDISCRPQRAYENEEYAEDYKPHDGTDSSYLVHSIAIDKGMNFFSFSL